MSSPLRIHHVQYCRTISCCWPNAKFARKNGANDFYRFQLLLRTSFQVIKTSCHFSHCSAQRKNSGSAPPSEKPKTGGGAQRAAPVRPSSVTCTRVSRPRDALFSAALAAFQTQWRPHCAKASALLPERTSHKGDPWLTSWIGAAKGSGPFR